MKVPQALLDEMVEHSRLDAPNECCGLIGGEADEAKTIHRMQNTAHSPLRYEMDSTEQLRVYREIMDAGHDIVGIYHSHTRTAAYPSQTDINLAIGWPDAVYFIVSLEDPDEPYIRGFNIREGQVEDVDIQAI
ncbi:MAG: M67 family metallopeptidase [Solirubrobacterales bacterium]|nr:M67 family metallopeptidase [Solirubrobacterales bacterium]HMT04235.1 M67 family metallopeptidase [Solirubrobacterales bacterium]